MLNHLHQDIMTAGSSLARANEASRQFWRRTFFRAFFAYVEAQLCAQKNLALLAHRTGNARFTVAELAMLEELQFDLDNGRARQRKRLLALTDNFRFGVYALAKAVRSPYVFDVGGEHWRWFRQAIAVRDRVTHPKALEDILISDEEVGKLFLISQWLLELNLEIVKNVGVDPPARS